MRVVKWHGLSVVDVIPFPYEDRRVSAVRIKDVDRLKELIVQNPG